MPTNMVDSGNGFLLKLSLDGRSQCWGTYIGGSGDDRFSTVLVSNGLAYVAGWTSSGDFPVTNAVQSTRSGENNGFLCAFVTSNGSPSAISYLGGGGESGISGLSFRAGNLHLVGGGGPVENGTNLFYSPLPIPGNTCGGGDCLIMRMSP